MIKDTHNLADPVEEGTRCLFIDVIDVSNPASPKKTGTWVQDKPVNALCAVGPYLLKGDGGDLKIIDATSVKSEVVIDTLPGISNVKDIAVDGNYAYLSCTGGLRIIHLVSMLGGIAQNPTTSGF